MYKMRREGLWGVRTDIVAVLVVTEGPVPQKDGVDNGHGAVKGKFGNLGRRQLAKGVAELGDGRVLLGAEGAGDDAVVASLLDRVLDDLGLLEVDGGRDDIGAGLVGGVGRGDKLAELFLVAVALIDKVLRTDRENLGILVSQKSQSEVVGRTAKPGQASQLTLPPPFASERPIRSLSPHSNRIMLEVTSPSESPPWAMYLRRMKGSTGPPQVFLSYMPVAVRVRM